MNRGGAHCPACDGTSLRVLVDMTLHPRLMRRADGRLALGALHSGRFNAVRRQLAEREVRGDDDVVCDGCNWLGPVSSVFASGA